MAGVNDPSKNCVLPPHSACKRRRIGVPSLPREIIFQILLCLPADIIYNVMRYVCREWYNIIKDPIFIDLHIKESPTCFLVQMRMSLNRYSALCVETRKHGIEITDLNLSRKGLSRFWSSRQFLRYGETNSKAFRRGHSCGNGGFPGCVFTSCRGLVLVSDARFGNCLHVANLLSKQWVKLPPLRVNDMFERCAGLAYAASCKRYKVVYTYYTGRDYFFGILTLGVDKAWRYIFSSKDISCIRRKADRLDLFIEPPFSAGGCMHWVSSTYVLSLEVETESFHVSVLPDFTWKYKGTSFLATESYLSFMGIHREYIWELWALTMVETGEWARLLEIDLTAQKPELELRFGPCGYTLEPVGLSKNGETVVFKFNLKPSFSRDLLVYNVKTREIDFLQFDKKEADNVVYFSHHVKSLVQLEPAE